jgi:hypothetical protein
MNMIDDFNDWRVIAKVLYEVSLEYYEWIVA